MKSFVKGISVDVDTITINNNLPMPPNTQETDTIGVLPVFGLPNVLLGMSLSIHLFLLVLSRDLCVAVPTSEQSESLINQTLSFKYLRF